MTPIDNQLSVGGEGAAQPEPEGLRELVTALKSLMDTAPIQDGAHLHEVAPQLSVTLHETDPDKALDALWDVVDELSAEVQVPIDIEAMGAAKAALALTDVTPVVAERLQAFAQKVLGKGERTARRRAYLGFGLIARRLLRTHRLRKAEVLAMVSEDGRDKVMVMFQWRWSVDMESPEMLIETVDAFSGLVDQEEWSEDLPNEMLIFTTGGVWTDRRWIKRPHGGAVTRVEHLWKGDLVPKVTFMHALRHNSCAIETRGSHPAFSLEIEWAATADFLRSTDLMVD